VHGYLQGVVLLVFIDVHVQLLHTNPVNPVADGWPGQYMILRASQGIFTAIVSLCLTSDYRYFSETGFH
jgi:hypothetical protein